MALKKVKDLDKAEKLLLINAVASGEVCRKTLTPDSLFCTDYRDYFLAVMKAASPGNEKLNIICIGKATQAQKDAITDIFIQNNEGERVLSLKSGKLK